ncbi:MAG: FeoB-associated Cys-rich membrane protein [Bacteroidetes bacterium]|nr:FeoB-associated Cys-rich membrane protein [Bacteroidota bacterium]
MNDNLQTILVIITVGFAAWFLVKKFLWNPKKKKNSCDKDDCGCH